MFEKIKLKIKKNTEIFALSLLIIITVISTSFYNQSKKKSSIITKIQLTMFI